MQLICIGHQAPAFKARAPYHFISPHKIDGHPSIVIPDDHLGEAFNGRFLSEYTQLFVLAQKLEAERSTEPLYLFQYRKFIAAREPQNRSTNFSYAFACKADEAERLFPTEEELQAFSGATVVGPILHRPLIAQYIMSHVARDIVLFTHALVKSDEFDQQRLYNFLDCPFIFPAPSLGVYHPEMFLRHMRILRDIWTIYYENYYVERDGPNRRVGGFLLERLHSFLIYEELTNPRSGTILTGHQVVVSNSLVITATI